jgi:hypothetical protein
MKSILAYPLIGILLTGAFLCQSILLQKRFSFTFSNPSCSWCEDSQTDEIQFIPTNTLAIRLFAPADPELIADLLWLRTTYYFGAHAVTDQDYFYLSYLLNRITDLSPKWEYVYVFGGIVLFLEALAPKQALLLIEKGITNISDSWHLFFLKGYIHWKAYEDHEASAKAIFKASQLEGAPNYLTALSVSLAGKSGDSYFSDAFNQIVLNTLKDPHQKELIQNKIAEGK